MVATLYEVKIMADISKLNLTGSDYDIKDSVARDKLTVVDPNEGEGFITFGVDTNGNYGYKKVGADTVIPFKTGTTSINYKSFIQYETTESLTLGVSRSTITPNNFLDFDFSNTNVSNYNKLIFVFVSSSSNTSYPVILYENDNTYESNHTFSIITTIFYVRFIEFDISNINIVSKIRVLNNGTNNYFIYGTSRGPRYGVLLL